MDADDYDNPWKQAIDEYFADFIACYFPQAHQDIDWAAGYETLDKELPGLARDADLGQRYADKLVKVRTRQGQHDLVYVHIEVQGQHDPDFAQRMFVYHYRIFDRFGQPPVSLAVLADEHPHWKPSRYGYQRWGCALEFAFPTVKLSEHTQSLDALLASDNPFAILTAAHWLTRRSKRNMDERLASKLRLIKLLYHKGWTRQAVLDFFAVIDWMMHLPEALTQQFRQQLADYEQENIMRYVTSVERQAREEGVLTGLQQGMQQGIQQGEAAFLLRQLNRRFGALPAEWVLRVQQASHAELELWGERVLDAASLDEVFAPQTH